MTIGNSRPGDMLPTNAPVSPKPLSPPPLAPVLLAGLVISGALMPAEAKAGSGPLHLDPPAHAEIIADKEDFADMGALPDAPDLDVIPFFRTGSHAAYLRADAGFGALSSGGALTANGRFNPTLSGPGIAGFGIGYKFGYILRGDVTGEFRSRASVQTVDGIYTHLSGAAVLANVYADIGTWYGVTPYVGVGAGYGWSRFSRHDASGSVTRGGFAWALMGGFSVELAPQLKLDIGYRYLAAPAPRTAALYLKNPGSHDIRIGLRWQFGEAGADMLP